MDIMTFARSLLHSLDDVKAVQRVAIESEGPVVNGRAYLRNQMFLSFYYNEITETIAFALILDENRIWGLDFDNIRGWHSHPVADPGQHVKIPPQNLAEIIRQFAQALEDIDEQD